MTYCGWTKSCTTSKPWETIVCWYLRGNHHSSDSQGVRNGFRNHAQYAGIKRFSTMPKAQVPEQCFTFGYCVQRLGFRRLGAWRSQQLDHGWPESRTSQARSAQRCRMRSFSLHFVKQARDSTRQGALRKLVGANCASCSTQIALCKLLCASCSAQVAPASWSLASCSVQIALPASCSVQAALCKLLCASCSA